MPAVLTRSREALPGLTGIARVDKNSTKLLSRVGPGDIVILDTEDLDRLTADALVSAEVLAVVNVSGSFSGRYPNSGPEMLVANGIVLIDEVGPAVLKRIKDGTRVRLHDGGVYAGEKQVARGFERDGIYVASRLIEAKSALIDHLEAFSDNTVEFVRTESALLIDGVGIPRVKTPMRGAHVVVVADGADRESDLKALKAFIREYSPILVGVGTGADTLVDAGYRPRIILGDPDGIGTEALRSGAELILPADPDGHAEGLERIQDLGVGATTFPAEAGPVEQALLLVDHQDPAMIVLAGGTRTFEDFLDSDLRDDAPAAFVTRMRVGPKLVDAKAVSTLYGSRMTGVVMALLVMAVLVAVVAAVMLSDAGPAVIDAARSLWDSASGWARDTVESVRSQ